MLTRPVKTPSQAGHPWQTDFLHCQAAPDMYKVSSAFSDVRRRGVNRRAEKRVFVAKTATMWPGFALDVVPVCLAERKQHV